MLRTDIRSLNVQLNANNVYCSFGLAHNCLNGNTGKFTLNVFTILDCQKDILLYYGANVNNNHK